MVNVRLERLKPILACPHCGGSLDFATDSTTCQACTKTYQIHEGKIYFIEVPDRTDALDNMKGQLKQWLGKYYYSVGVGIVAPTYPFGYLSKILERLDPTKQIVIDVGCGNHRIDENIICLDMFDYRVVDVVCDLSALPFKPNSIDAFVSRSVLEHVPDPVRVVHNFYHCTRRDGLGLHLIPFLFPFHASPYDYQRYTHKGLEILFKDFEIVEQTNATGPITLFLLIFIEFLSIIFSLGAEPVKAYIYLILCTVLFPLKYIDIFFVNRKTFLTLAPSIFTVVCKRNESTSA